MSALYLDITLLALACRASPPALGPPWTVLVPSWHVLGLPWPILEAALDHLEGNDIKKQLYQV
jgi:hypothetical protein